MAGDFSKQRYLASMEGAILSGQLAAKAVAETMLEREKLPDYTPPARLEPRPRDPKATDINDVTPDMAMYTVRKSPMTPEIEKTLSIL